MGMPETTGRVARDMVLALPDDGNRYELFDGELLVTPAPSYLHQRLVMAFYHQLYTYVRAHGLGEVLVSPADVPLDGEQVAQPDLFVIPPSAVRPPASWTDLPNPILALEVLSPPPTPRSPGTSASPGNGAPTPRRSRSTSPPSSARSGASPDRAGSPRGA